MDSHLVSEFRAIVGDAGLVSAPEQLRTYECDGLTVFRVVPELVLLPASSAELQAVVKLCHREHIPFVPRGSGTGLSGGALPVKGAVVIGVSRMNRILDVDLTNARVVVEPGVTNSAITAAVAGNGYFYAPDPSSQIVCTIAGNVAENSGGAHCFKYGVTTTYILGLEVVLSDGSLVRLGGSTLDYPGYDLVGAFVGSEGTFGIVTKITLRIIKKPECAQTLMAAFNSTSEAGAAVSSIIASGMFPAAMEIMDRLALEAAEAAVHANYPDCQALLLVELDGSTREVELLMEQLGPICTSCGAWQLRLAKSEAECIAVWKGRKAAFAAVGRISPNYLVQDGVIPRTALPRVLGEIERLSAEAGLRVANVFHAGDGNLHPLVLYDRRIAGQEQRAMTLAEDILRLCVEAGGSITGEHGIGEEKKYFMPVMFSAADLDAMQRLRSAFDPDELCNPTKMFPGTDIQDQGPIAYEPHPIEVAALAPRY
ncbi:MAG TPA: FAD-linked oxidase C-terminal domain-containing protein [Terracidiphilus sp.]|nr:FAD-linked oxidase C-terminal domain-containing protein [Terracidiphilus sp.]